MAHRTNKAFQFNECDYFEDTFFLKTKQTQIFENFDCNFYEVQCKEQLYPPSLAKQKEKKKINPEVEIAMLYKKMLSTTNQRVKKYLKRVIAGLENGQLSMH